MRATDNRPDYRASRAHRRACRAASARCHGVGQALDVSLLDSAFTLTEIPIAQYLTSGREPKRNGNRAGALAPSNTYRARDGWVYVIAVQQKMWERFYRAAERHDLADD